MLCHDQKVQNATEQTNSVLQSTPVH